ARDARDRRVASNRLGARVTTRRAAVVGASFVLEHVPDLVRYGSKPVREPSRTEELLGSLRTFDDAVAYPPNQVFIGNSRPNALWDVERPWWGRPSPGASAFGPTGEMIDQAAFYELLVEVDQFDLVHPKEEPKPGDVALYSGDEIVGAVVGAHEVDETLQAPLLLENLAIKASAVHALRDLLTRTGADPAGIGLVIG